MRVATHYMKARYIFTRQHPTPRKIWCYFGVLLSSCMFCAKVLLSWQYAGSFFDSEFSHEVKLDGEFEISQTHVAKAVNEERHAPKVIAQREAELLFK
jgi:hypothetical protein